MTVLQLLGDSALALSSAGDFFWEADIFRKESWDGITNMVRLLLTIGGAILLMAEVRARKMRERFPELWKRRIAMLMTVAAFGVYFDFFNPNVRYVEYYHRHEFFHYYLGSKYFNEIGYNRLYECAAIAEVELGRGAQVRNREIRDLRVNLIKPISATYVLSNPEECKQHFTTERWQAWKQDVDWFYHSSAGNYWEDMQKDHGYNPPPVWTMAGKFFSSFGVAGDKFFKVLAGVDILLHVLIIALFYWAFGWRISAIATVFWGCNAPANFYWTGGAFLRQDWLFLLVAALCLARKRYFFAAGFALMWSSLLRVFPVIFFGGWAIIVVFETLRRLRNGEAKNGVLGLLHPDHRRLIGGSLVALGVLVPASVAVCGADAYKEFFGHTIKVHNATPLTNHMGLETMLVHDWSGRMRFLRDDNFDDPFQLWKKGRLDRLKQRKVLFIAIIVGVFGWTAWALRRTKLLWVGLALSLGIQICLTNLTCYYYSMFIVAAALVAARKQLGPVLLLGSGLSSVLLYAPRGFYWVDDRFAAQAWLFFTLAALCLYAYSRPFSMERLRAWWRGKPEQPTPAPSELEPNASGAET